MDVDGAQMLRVRQHDALGLAGRARGVEERGEVEVDGASGERLFRRCRAMSGPWRWSARVHPTGQRLHRRRRAREIRGRTSTRPVPPVPRRATRCARARELLENERSFCALVVGFTITKAAPALSSTPKMRDDRLDAVVQSRTATRSPRRTPSARSARARPSATPASSSP